MSPALLLGHSPTIFSLVNKPWITRSMSSVSRWFTCSRKDRVVKLRQLLLLFDRRNMAQSAFLHGPSLFAGIHRILMTTPAAGMKRCPAFRHFPLRNRLMTVVTIFGLSLTSRGVMTGGAVHSFKSRMHFMHESHNTHFAPIEIENFLTWRNLFGTHR